MTGAQLAEGFGLNGEGCTIDLSLQAGVDPIGVLIHLKPGLMRMGIHPNQHPGIELWVLGLEGVLHRLHPRLQLLSPGRLDLVVNEKRTRAHTLVPLTGFALDYPLAYPADNKSIRLNAQKRS